MADKPAVIQPRTWTVTIHHALKLGSDEPETFALRLSVKAETDTEAVVVAMVRTKVERSRMGSRVIQVDVG